jgi:hypothetical protein
MKSENLTGGLFPARGNPRPLSARAPKGPAFSESAEQAAFFSVLRRNEPHRPMRARDVHRKDGRVERVFEPAYGTPEYVAYLCDPLYVLTRVRHFPNGGFRHDRVAARMKLEGVRPGAFDIYLDAARRGSHGLRMEMKAGQRGELSDEQGEEREWLLREGYSPHSVWNYKEGLDVLLWYIDVSAPRIVGYPSRWERFDVPAKGGHNERCGCDLKI